MKYDYEEIGNRIRTRRKEVNLSQETVEATIGISHATFSKLENGKLPEQSCNLNMFLKLCHVLDCDMNYLLGIQEKPKMTIVEASNIIGLSHDTVLEISNLDQKQRSVLDNLASVNIPTNKETALQVLINSVLDYVMCPPVANVQPIKAQFSDYEYQINHNEALAFIKTAIGKNFDTILDSMYEEYEQERNAIVGKNLDKIRTAANKIQNMSKEEQLEAIRELNNGTKMSHE